VRVGMRGFDFVLGLQVVLRDWVTIDYIHVTFCNSKFSKTETFSAYKYNVDVL
jgi:hypothetical protein